MTPRRYFIFRFRALFQKRKLDADMDEEIRSHIELQAQQNIEGGMSPEEARYAAWRQFGGAESVKEICREQRGVTWLEHFFQDLRFGCRMMRKSPGFTAVAVLALALGIGANTAIFSLVSPLLLHTISGVREPARLLAFDFKPSNKPMPLPVFSYPDFLEFPQGLKVLEGMAAYRNSFATLGADEHARKIQLLMVSPNWFRLLGVPMLAGRSFAEGEGKLAGADPVAIISESLWRRRFNADPSIVGRDILLSGHPFTVIGVAARFRFEPLVTSEAWALLTMHGSIEAPAAQDASRNVDALADRRSSWVTWLGRLNEGATLEQAQPAVDLRARQLGEAYGAGMGTMMGYYPLTVLPKVEYNRRQVTQAANVTVFLFVLSGLVLLIACANLANLLLARAITRRQEIAVRLALGATRLRLIRQLLTEGILLAMAGGLAGILTSSWTVALFARSIGQIAARSSFPIELEASLDWDLFAFGFGLSLVAGVMFALAPSLRASRPDLMVALKGQAESRLGGLAKLSWRNALVVGQVALCFLLLVVAALFTRGLSAAQHVDLGFQPAGVLVMPIDLQQQNISKAQAPVLFDQIRERLNSLPTVSGVAFARHCQGDNTLSMFRCSTSGAEATNAFVFGNIVSPGYFQALQTPLVRGREFSSVDLSGPPVVILNESLATLLWPGLDPLGKQVNVSGQNPEDSAGWAEVIGVAKDGHYLSLFQNDKRSFLYRLPSRKGESMTLMLRINGDRRAILPLLRTELQAIDKRLPIYELKPLADLIAPWGLLPKIGALLAGGIGLLGLFLASIGLYGLLAYVVGQRTKEFGIRLALGAQRSEIVSLVLRQGLSLVLVGSLLGLVLALAGTRIIRNLLFGVSPLDMAAFGAVCLLLTAVALLACYLPARRATKVDPMIALRYE
jgi:predicted permease